MATQNNSLAFRIAVRAGVFFLAASAPIFTLAAQAPVAAPATPAANQLGTVKAISGNTITMATDKGQTLTVSVAGGAKVYQLAVGSTDLKTAKPGQMTDVAVGDRAMVTGKPGDTAATFSAVRVILMKSSDIAQMQAAQQADWKARGIAGIVNTIDPAAGAITVTAGTRKVIINTSSKTVFRRFAGDSVKYQDAKIGTIAQIQPKDELQARGAKSADGASIDAEEVISGSFENLSGLLISVDSAAGTITLKDLATKKMVTVSVTANSDIRNMPAQMATRFAAQSSGRKAGAGQDAAGSAGGTGESRRSAGADISQMIGRLAAITLADVHKGDAVMIVASRPASGTNTATAMTVLTGVDPILTANPNGGMDLSMSMGGGGGPD